ncbi:uncharacterized protein BDV14DRAFT_118217 [Aspergillus stella-maris]|uniref:uncharacterized protein n=1 Tax=Aspergillus stella-maris TaxID=1810926 RepID=UPI003CCD555A
MGHIRKGLASRDGSAPDNPSRYTDSIAVAASFHTFEQDIRTHELPVQDIQAQQTLRIYTATTDKYLGRQEFSSSYRCHPFLPRKKYLWPLKGIKDTHHQPIYYPCPCVFPRAKSMAEQGSPNGESLRLSKAQPQHNYCTRHILQENLNSRLYIQ